MLSQIIRFYGNSMQGLMGNYLEKTMQSFVDIHGKLSDQSKGVTGGTDAWAQAMNMQNPMMQGLMGNYMEQSKDSVYEDARADAKFAKYSLRDFLLPHPRVPK
jgi:polyhydroxyalkanoate synthesis regulator protein